MCTGSIPDLINGLYSSVKCSIISDSSVCTKNIVINRSRDPDKRDIIIFIKYLCTGKSSISTNYHNTVDILLFQIIICFFSACLSFKFFASCCFKYSTASLDYFAYTMRFKRFEESINQSLVSLHDTGYFKIIIDSCPYNGTNSCIHPRSIST